MSRGAGCPRGPRTSWRPVPQSGAAPGPAEPRSAALAQGRAGRAAQSRAGPRGSRARPQSPHSGREGPRVAEPGADLGALRDGSRAGSQPGRAQLKGAVRAGAQDGNHAHQRPRMRHEEQNPAAPRLRAQAQSHVSAPLGCRCEVPSPVPAAARPGTSLRWRCWTCPAVGKPLPAGATFFGRGRIQRASSGAAAGRGSGSACRSPQPPAPHHRPFPAPGAAIPVPASPGAPGGIRLTSPLGWSRRAGTVPPPGAHPPAPG